MTEHEELTGIKNCIKLRILQVAFDDLFILSGLPP